MLDRVLGGKSDSTYKVVVKILRKIVVKSALFMNFFSAVKYTADPLFIRGIRSRDYLVNKIVW